MRKMTVKTTIAAQDVLLLNPVGGTTQPGEPEPKAFCIRRKRLTPLIQKFKLLF